MYLHNDKELYTSAKPISILPCSRQRVVCGARADLRVERAARDGPIKSKKGA